MRDLCLQYQEKKRRSARILSSREETRNDVLRKCKACSEEIKECKLEIECSTCGIFYHVRCTNMPESVTELYSKNNLRLWLKWTCNDCKDEDTSSKVDKLDTDNVRDNLKSEILQEVKELLQDVIRPQINHPLSQKAIELENSTTEKGKKTMNDMLKDIKNEIIQELKDLLPSLISSSRPQLEPKQKQIPVNTVKHGIIIKPKDDDKSKFTEESWSALVKNSFTTKLSSIPVKKALLTKTGVGYVVFPDKTSRDSAVEGLKEECITVLSDKNQKHIYPKLKISGISKEYVSENGKNELRKEIINKNTFIRQHTENKKVFEIIFIDNNRDSNFCHAVVKVDPDIKEAISNNGNRVFIGLSSCRAIEQYHLIQCYRCQEFGHKRDSLECPLKDTATQVCLYCTADHLSKSCTVKKNQDKLKCSNCLKSKNKVFNSSYEGHTSTSFTCPILQLELKSLKNRTLGDDINKEVSKNSITT